MILCRQAGCRRVASYRYAWPGSSEELTICEDHSAKLRAVVSPMGFQLLLIPLTIDDHGNALHPLAAGAGPVREVIAQLRKLAGDLQAGMPPARALVAASVLSPSTVLAITTDIVAAVARQQRPPAVPAPGGYVARTAADERCGHEHPTVASAFDCIVAKGRRDVGSENDNPPTAFWFIRRLDGKPFTIEEEDDLWRVMARYAELGGVP